MPWCLSVSLTRGGGENVPGTSGACATRNFTYLQEAHTSQTHETCLMCHVGDITKDCTAHKYLSDCWANTLRSTSSLFSQCFNRRLCGKILKKNGYNHVWENTKRSGYSHSEYFNKTRNHRLTHLSCQDIHYAKFGSVAQNMVMVWSSFLSSVTKRYKPCNGTSSLAVQWTGHWSHSGKWW